jgi:hypothetical protein
MDVGDRAGAAAEASAHAAGLRALLLHLASPAVFPSQRLLARCACVCRAWRDEAALPAHNRVLLFEDAAAADANSIARLIERHAAHVEGIHASRSQLTLAATLLAPDALLPRLLYVREAGIPGSPVTPEAAAALLRAAPLLSRWEPALMPFAAVNLVPAVLCAMFGAVVGDEEFAATPVRVMAHATRGLLSPARSALFLHAFVHADYTGPEVSALAPLLHDAETPPELSAFIAVRLQALSTPYLPHWFPNQFLSPFMWGLRGALTRPRMAERTLLHHAVSGGNVGAAAVLLRAGADPLAGHPSRISALHAAAAALLELQRAADAVPENRTVGKLVSCLVRPIARRLSVFRLLRAEAVRRHGVAAVQAALESALAGAASALPSEHQCKLLTLCPFIVNVLLSALAHPVLSASAVTRNNACANAPYTAQLHEARAYVSHGDARAAARRRTLVFWGNWAPAWLLIAAAAAAALWLAWWGVCLAWRLAWALLLLPPRTLNAVYNWLFGGAELLP